MKPYRILNTLIGVFYLLGLLGLAGTGLLVLGVIIRFSAIDLVSAAIQIFGMLFASLILLGLSELFAAVIEIVTRLREQQSVIARIEVKLNNLRNESNL